jgi:hypothetical protein
MKRLFQRCLVKMIFLLVNTHKTHELGISVAGVTHYEGQVKSLRLQDLTHENVIERLIQVRIILNGKTTR